MRLLLGVAAAALVLAVPAAAAPDTVLRVVSTGEHWAMPNASVRGPQLPPTEDGPAPPPVPLAYAEFGYRLKATLPGQQLRLVAYVSCTRADGVTRMTKRSLAYVARRGALSRTLWLARPLEGAQACEAFGSVLRFSRSARTGAWVPATRGRMVVTLLAR